MSLLILLTDREPAVALPALAELDVNVKTEPLTTAGAEHAAGLGPSVALVDAAENPGQAWVALQTLHEAAPSSGRRVPVLLVVERDGLRRRPWEEVADGFCYPGAPAAEIELRLAMLRSAAGSEDAVVRLGPLVLDAIAYRVQMDGRPLDLTFKEFELLRFLASQPGRVFTRPTLLREVWGYDFYGGTRTVDVHVRRLRAKLGPEHEGLIETVRGVGYAARDDDPRS